MDQLAASRVLHHVTNGARLYGIQVHRGDTHRIVQIFVATDANHIVDITVSVAIALGLRLTPKGVRINGTGLNVMQHVAELIEQATGLKNLEYELISTEYTGRN